LSGMRLPGEPGLRFSAAASPAQALELLQAHADIDLVVSDFALQQGSGLDLLQTVGLRWPTVVRVLMSGTSDPAVAINARRQGLMGFVPKSLEPAAFVLAIETVLGGEPWFPADVDSSHAGRGVLTERQARVLACVATGQSNKEAARTLGISERTIKYHLEGAYLRLEVGNRAEAVVSALARGLISLPA
jgi:DNA-binding NarL/FixJ family response regulator